MTPDIQSSLSQPIARVVRSLREEATQPGLDGNHYPVGQPTMLSESRADMLWRLARQVQTNNTLETGFAYGLSSLMLLDVIGRSAGGRHTAIDPYQRSLFRGIGLRVVERCGMTDRFRLIDQDSALAMPDLIRAGERFDLVMIDGNHLFAGVFIDVAFGAKLCREGGLLVLDDLWLPSVRKVQRFIEHNMPWLRPVGVEHSGLAAYQCGKAVDHWFDFFADF